MLKAEFEHRKNAICKLVKDETGKTAKTISQIGLFLWQVETDDAETYMVTY